MIMIILWQPKRLGTVRTVLYLYLPRPTLIVHTLRCLGTLVSLVLFVKNERWSAAFSTVRLRMALKVTPSLQKRLHLSPMNRLAGKGMSPFFLRWYSCYSWFSDDVLLQGLPPSNPTDWRSSRHHHQSRTYSVDFTWVLLSEASRFGPWRNGDIWDGGSTAISTGSAARAYLAFRPSSPACCLKSCPKGLFQFSALLCPSALASMAATLGWADFRRWEDRLWWVPKVLGVQG